jgi:hypothetical protein
MAVENLSSGNDDGTSLGQSASDKVSLHGVTPAIQASAITLATGATIATVVTAVQSIITALSGKGITAA